MARNLELKVRCDEAALEHVRGRAKALGAGAFSHMIQTDTYFNVNAGRLKLREIAPARGKTRLELIAYRRPDESGSRWSDYQLVALPAETATAVKQALAISCGISVVIEKRRSAGIWRSTRIHLDTVKGLGCFVELETVARPGDLDEAVHEEHEQAILNLGLRGMPVISGSYSDLVAAGAVPAPSNDQEKGFSG